MIENFKDALNKSAEKGGQCFVPAESVKNEETLYVFPIFNTAQMEQKIRHPAADDLL